MSQNLIKYEKNERYLATQLFKSIKTVKSYSFTQGRICYDFIVNTTDDKSIIGEIKVRSFDISKYPDYILQVDKLLGLIKRAKANKFDKIYYINFFISDKKGHIDYIIFELTERINEWKINRPQIKNMLMNAETHKSKEYKVWKDVILLTDYV